MSRVVRRIRQLCLDRNLAFNELGRRVGVTPQAMQRWWRGEANPALETRLLIAEEFGIPFDSLRLGGEEHVDAEFQSEATIEEYLRSTLGQDLTSEERKQLRLSALWVPGTSPLSPRDVHHMAELIRMRLRQPERLPVLNPLPLPSPPGTPKKRRPTRRS